jgi:anaerobic C4-dicarboxylate transporter
MTHSPAKKKIFSFLLTFFIMVVVWVLLSGKFDALTKDKRFASGMDAIYSIYPLAALSDLLGQSSSFVSDISSKAA